MSRYSRTVDDLATWPGTFLTGKDSMAVARALEKYADDREAEAQAKPWPHGVEALFHVRQTRALIDLLRACWVKQD